jgi:type IV pilus assembly protein PilC
MNKNIFGKLRKYVKKFRKKTLRVLGSVQKVSFARFSIAEQTLFAKRMAFLIKAGVPLVECLSLIRTQTKSETKKLVLASVITDVSSGQYLSTSLAKSPHFFGHFSISLIRVGEKSGILSQNLVYLADELQKKNELKRKVIGALIYPIFITIATLGVTGVLTVYIFPKLMPIFTGLHVTLPFTTRVLIWVSRYLAEWGILTLLGFVILGIAFFVLYRRDEKIRYATDRFLLRIPFVASIARAYNLTNFCRTLGLLLRSGITITDAILITAETSSNLAYQQACANLATVVMRGEPISHGLAQYPNLYPDMVVHMIAVGEKTGNLSTTLTYLGEMYENEVNELTRGLSSSIEPMLMLVMGLLVGTIAVSVITPIYQITQHLQSK